MCKCGFACFDFLILAVAVAVATVIFVMKCRVIIFRRCVG